MDLNKLRIVEPLLFRESIETLWVDVKAYNHVRLTTFTDIDLTLEIMFSRDATDFGPVTSLVLTKQTWLTRRVDILLDYMKIRVVNHSQIENKMLLVNVLGRKGIHVESTVPKVIVEYPVQQKDELEYVAPNDMIVHEPADIISDKADAKVDAKLDAKLDVKVNTKVDALENHSKSPAKNFRFWRRRVESNVRRSQSVDRFPEFIPKSSILVGGFSNKIVTIPPPASDAVCYLCFKDGTIQWIDISEKKISWKV